MPTARKLPSGNYRVRVFVGMDGDKKVYKSITAPTKREAEYLAAQYKLENKTQVSNTITLTKAIDQYIHMKENIFSASTIATYRKIQRNYYQNLLNKRVQAITSNDLEKEVNRMAKTLSPKTVSNAYHFILTVIRTVDPFFRTTVRLPQKEQKAITIPTYSEYVRMVNHAHGTEMEIPLLLFGCMGLRVSELRALTWNDIDLDKRILRINKALVKGEHGDQLKLPKSDAGTRTLLIPENCMEPLRSAGKSTPQVTRLTHSMLEKRMYKICKDLNLSPISPHKLRHFHDSVLHALNVPTAYGMRRMGHVTENMYNRQYSHEIPERQREVEQEISDGLSTIFNKYATTDDTYTTKTQ